MMRRSAPGSETATAQPLALPPISLRSNLDLLRQFVGGADLVGHGAGGVIGQDEAVVALALQRRRF